MKEYFKKNVAQGEFEIYKILSSGIADTYNNGFSTLVLPQAVDTGDENSNLKMPFYEGETFNDAWDISNGGSPMGLRLAKEMPLVLKELAQIDPTPILANQTLAAIPRLAFDYQEAKSYFGSLAVGLKNAGGLSDEDCDKITEILAFEQTTSLMVNNGDFYPRNLIKRADGKVVLIDWETWNDHSPFYIVDHPENVAAVAYVHMWGNPEWQATFRSELSKHFSFSAKGFDKGIAIKALTLASFFRKHDALFDGQIDTLNQLLRQN